MNKFLLLVVVALAFSACQKDDDNSFPDSILQNASLETGTGNIPEGWWQNPGPNNMGWTDDEAYQGDRSILMNSTSNSPNFSFWAQTHNEDIDHGQMLNLSLYLKLDSIQGQGLSLVIRGDETPNPEGTAEYFFSTEGNTPIVGTHDWTEYNIATTSVIPESIQSITIYLILLPETTGTAYFDAVKLEYL